MSTEIESEINCEGADVNDTRCKEIDDDVVKQFKIIMIIVLIVLIAFLGFFVYNLIKCYLPKWRARLNEEKVREVNIEQDEGKGTQQIEFENIQSKL